jgi:signal recognition particle subunit SRP19
LKTSTHGISDCLKPPQSDNLLWLNYFSEKQLLEGIANYIQKLHPELIAGVTDGGESHLADPEPKPEVKPSAAKKDKAKTTAAPRTAPAPIRKAKSQLPQPPPNSTRVSQYSPAQEANILIETIKAGMNAPAPGEGMPGNPMVPGGKGKRKVIRVRQ